MKNGTASKSNTANNMIPEYINNWFYIIESMKNENTYKLAWGRALVECIYRNLYAENPDGRIVVSLNDIAKCMLKYYWNQIFFFNLKQGPTRSDNRQPYVVQYTNKLIELYKTRSGSALPVWFDKAETDLNTSEVNKIIKKIANVLPNDVSWRFKEINNKEVPIYSYDNKARSHDVIFNKENISLIKEYAIIISKLFNYKWAQLLEKFNYAPRVANKVNSISDSKLKRESLTKYKNELMKQFKDGVAIDFYSGKPLASDDISVDHVIPWSFMYSDDIWNLVLTSKSNNSSKSNSIPSEEDIKKLKERNQKIVNLLDSKFSIEMKEAILNKYVDKYYFECRM